MQQIILEAQKREVKGKSSVRKIRTEGLVPGIVYGKKAENLQVSIPLPALVKAMAQGAAHKIINLKIDSSKKGDEKLCVIHEIQKDTFGQKILHVDFHHISMDEKITAKIPIEIEGTPAGTKEGGILEHVLWEVEIEALPLNLPEKLKVDVSALNIHGAIHVKDVVLPEGVKILEDAEEIVAVVHPPRAEEEVVAPAPAEGAVAVPAQPEVITKGKKEEEGAVEEKAPAAASAEKPAKK